MTRKRKPGPRKKILLTAWAALLALVLTFCLANAVCFFLMKSESYLVHKAKPPAAAMPGSVGPPPMGRAHVTIKFFGEHPLQSTELPRPGRYRAVSETASGEKIFDAPFTIDAQNLRTTVQEKSARERFAVFLGCSYTFGPGVEDHDTFPSVVAGKSPQYRVYNYSYPGYGANDLLARLEKQPLEKVVREKEGVVVYVFSYAHLLRARLPRSYLVREPWHAFFRELPDGSLKREGDFGTAHANRRKLQAFLLGWPLFQYLYGVIPSIWFDDDYRYMARLVAELMRRTEAELPGAKFLLVAHPSYETTAAFSRLAPFLDELKIPYRNYRAEDFYTGASEPLQFAYSGHPTAAGNRRFGERLAADLELSGAK